MFRLVRFGLAVLMVLTVAGILITPDSSDDVDGVLQCPVQIRTKIVSLLYPQIQSIPRPAFVFVAKVLPSSSSAILDLGCTLLC